MMSDAICALANLNLTHKRIVERAAVRVEQLLRAAMTIVDLAAVNSQAIEAITLQNFRFFFKFYVAMFCVERI